MERIKITIPDNLTPSQELIAIAKKLGKKMLPSGKIALGTGYEIKHLETTILIERKEVEKPITTRICYCGTTFEQSIGKTMWTNYGGNIRKQFYCSDECRSAILDVAGEGRAAISRKNLKPLIKF